MVKKDLLKGLVTGILISSLLFASINAAPIKKSLAVFLNNIQVVVDGVKISPADAKGNKVEPFSYEGTIYIPLRSVAEALGKEVTWDQKTYTAYIGKAQKDVVGINELTPWKDVISGSSIGGSLGAGWGENDYHFIMSQKNYTTQNSISAQFGTAEHQKELCKWHDHADGSSWTARYGRTDWMVQRGSHSIQPYDLHVYGDSNRSYKLNKEYYKLTGTFGIDDLSTYGISAILYINDTNGNELYSSKYISKGDTPITVDVDLLDQEQIEIVIKTDLQEGLQSEESIYAQFTDVKLYTVGK